MAEQTPRTSPAPRRGSLGQSVLTIAAAATTSAAVIWSALFYNASNQHTNTVAAAPAPATQVAPSTGTSQPAHAPAPVTTRTS